MVNSNGQVALIKMRKYGVWGFPKGRINENESPLDATKREVEEETGIQEYRNTGIQEYRNTGIQDLSLVKDLGDYQRPSADGRAIIINTRIFLFRSGQENLSPLENDSEEAIWVDKEKVSEILSLAEDKEFFLKNIKDLEACEWEYCKRI